MKITGRNLKRRLYAVASLPDRVARVRHFRGHGVHSPFVYQLVRKVFMRRDFWNEERALYEELRRRGVARRAALQLHNLAEFLGYSAPAFDACDAAGEWVILTPTLTDGETLAQAQRAASQGKTVVVMSPYADRERAALTQRLIEEHPCTSVDQRAYLLLFTHTNLPKQHYRI
ncbi:MAG: hypothetical protein IKZ12_02400 [Alistipes sp.]|nr:hypothetical protein [Alistipes sp.]